MCLIVGIEKNDKTAAQFKPYRKVNNVLIGQIKLDHLFKYLDKSFSYSMSTAWNIREYWPVFSRIRTKSVILWFCPYTREYERIRENTREYGRIRDSENLYSHIFMQWSCETIKTDLIEELPNYLEKTHRLQLYTKVQARIKI